MGCAVTVTLILYVLQLGGFLFDFRSSANAVDNHFCLCAVHRYNTRNAQDFRLPAVQTNWGKQRLSFQIIKD